MTTHDFYFDELWVRFSFKNEEHKELSFCI